MNQPPATDLATTAARSVTEATATPPDELPDNPQAYLRWLRDPTRPVRRPRPRKPLKPSPSRRGPAEVRDPAYPAAAALLSTLPDLGTAHIERARQEPGDTTWEAPVIRAAENASRT